MAAGDIYNISGSLTPSRPCLKMLGGGVDDGVQIDALPVAAVLANHTHGTVSAWIMVPDITGQYCIYGSGDASAVEYFYFGVNAGKLECKAAKAGPDVAFDMYTTAVQLTPYKWHHVAFVQDAVKPKFYVDGVLITAVTETDVTESGYWYDDLALNDGAHIGAADSIAGGAALTLEFKGLIGQVSIWSGTTSASALAVGEIIKDYHNESTTATPYGQYKFNDSDLYTNAANAGTYDGTKVGDFTRLNSGNEFCARLQYEPAVPALVADDISISMAQGVGHAVLVKAG